MMMVMMMVMIMMMIMMVIMMMMTVDDDGNVKLGPVPGNTAVFFVCHRSLGCNIFFQTYQTIWK
jgi:hypothetical protein